jgi:hypothetical protein
MLAAPCRKVWQGMFLLFAQETHGLGNQRKFLSIKEKVRHGPGLKNVLTAKPGSFWRHLAEKRAGRSKKKPFFFVFFRVFGILCPARG